MILSGIIMMRTFERLMVFLFKKQEAGGLSDEALAKAIRRQSELKDIISYVDEILGETQGAEQEF